MSQLTDRQLLKELGVRAVADRLGRPFTTVQSWSARPGGIPREHLLDVVRMGREAGLDVSVEGVLRAAAEQRSGEAA